MLSKMPLTALIVTVMLLLLVSIASATDQKDKKTDQKLYCDMTSLYIDDGLAGLNPEDRRGWPNYKNDLTMCD